VEYILTTSCGSCHNAALSFGGLDLTQLLEMPSGGYFFRHESKGQQLELSESITRIRQRLTTSDDSMRMPPGKRLDPARTSKLFKWFDVIGED